MLKKILLSLMICAVASLAIFQPANAQISEFKVKASDAVALDRFGVSVSIDGDYAVERAAYDTDNGIGSGSAYVYSGVTGTTSQDFWERTNGPYGGSVYSFVINSSGHIFTGTYRGGVFRSTDNGDTWTKTNNGPMGTYIYSLAINTTAGYIYAGTWGDYLYRSTDNGDSWTHINNSNGLSGGNLIPALAINSTGHIFAGTWGGVFRSTDNGDNWTDTGSGGNVNSLAINSTGHIFFGAFGGVRRSTDNGDTWTAINNGLTANPWSLAINSTDHIFAGTSDNGAFRSTDNGDTRTAINNGLTATRVYSLAINSTGHIFAGTSGGAFRSTDNGDTWTEINNGLTATSVNALVINSTTGHIFAGTSAGGVFRSTDNGDNWTEINIGLTNTRVYSLAINSTDHIFAGTSGYGAFRSTDNGGTWTQINTGLTNTLVWSLAINSTDHIFAGTSGGVFRSTDNGDTWTEINIGLTATDVNALVINSTTDHIFAGTSGGVFRSIDNGDSWIETNSGLTNPPIRSLTINSIGHIFAGTSGGGLFRSTDNGDNWTEINNGLTATYVSSLAINSTGHIFAGTLGAGLFRSTDNGNTWTYTGLTNHNVLSLALNSTGGIFATTEYGGGVFRSTDNGDNWTEINSGLTNIVARPLAINSTDHIFAGTIGSGIFRSVESTRDPTPFITSIIDVPHDQGGWVTLNWNASSLDVNVNNLPYYSIWRALPVGTVLANSATSATDITADFTGEAYRIESFSGNHLAFEWIANQPAHRFATYSYTAPTLFDSSSATFGKHYFMVSAHTNDPDLFYDSEIDSGYSVDNLAPLPPANLAGTLDPNAAVVELHWNPNSEEDLSHYLLYRSTSPEINPDVTEPIATIEDTLFVDSDLPLSNVWYYTLVAEDIHNNGSDKSNEISIMIVGVDGETGAVPNSFNLSQNYPNPFNPQTLIKYDLPKSSDVIILIYNLHGEEVIRLVDGQQSAGHHHIVWNASGVASGIYFYRLQAGDFIETKKMILMK